MSALSIRQVVEEDLPVLLALQSQLTPSTLELALPAFRRMKAYPSYAVYLAWADGHAVGTFAILVMDNLGHMGSPIAVVENVVVDQGQRRRGIGRRMINFATQTALDHGCYKMILGSNMKLEDAHRFYESIGFRRQGYVFSLDL